MPSPKPPRRRLLALFALFASLAAGAADPPDPAHPASADSARHKPARASKGKPPATARVEPAPPLPAPAPAPAPVDEGFRRAPAPAWIAAVTMDAQAEVPKAPLHYDLLEEQTRLDGTQEQHFQHAIRVVNDSSALGSAAQLEVEFDPSYQQLTLNQLTILRGNERIDKLATARVNLLHREGQLERQVYDGRLSASIVLEDLRVGDRVEFAYTLNGGNPVFDGRFVDQSWVASIRGPIRQYQYRLLAPEARDIHARLPAGVTAHSTVQDGWRETLFRKAAIAVVPQEVGIAPVYFRELTLQLSEFADWSAVSAWAEQVFAQAGPIAAAVREQADALKSGDGPSKDPVRRALDFVQTEIRYFGTESGVGSHRPAPPEQVLRQRFGDCKDKVVLLATLLRAMGIDARPTLVSTSYREDVAQLLPSPLAFDHVILQVGLDGQDLWLDATRGFQHGQLAGRQALAFGRGLVIGGAPGLSELPNPADLPRIETQESLHFTALSADPVLDSRVTFHGDVAETVRAMAASVERGTFEKNWTGDYARFYPKITLLEPIVLEEQEDSNDLVVHARYGLPQYFRFNEQHALTGDFALTSLVQVIQLPGYSQRATPFARNAPGIYRHSLTVEYPEDTNAKDSVKRYDESNRYFALHIEWSNAKRSAGVKGEMRLLPGAVAARDWSAYVDTVRKQALQLAGSASVSPVRPQDLPALGARIATVQDGLKGFWVKDVDAWQAPYKIKLLVLSAQLDGGRLPPHLRTDILVDRGVQLDLLDRAKDAERDFAEALKLAPDKASVLSAAAVNASLRGDDEQALSLAAHALAQDPGDAGSRSTRAFTFYQTQRYPETIQELQPLLSDASEVQRMYGAILLALATQGSGGDGAAAARAHDPGSAQAEWPHPVLRLLEGALSLDDAVAAARKDGKPDAGRLCELYYYAAERSLLSGDAAAARKLYQRSLDTGVTGFNEYAFARRALARLATH